MALSLQYDLFEPIPTDTMLCQKQIDALLCQQDRLRKGLFVRHNELAKMIIKQQDEIDRLKQMIYKLERVK
jgi:hypothetical protein